MPNFEMFPLAGSLLSATTITTNTTTAAFSLPFAQSFRLIAEVNTVSGTSPTMQVIFATSADGGTTYDEILSMTPDITTTGLGRQIVFRPYLGYGDVATEFASGLLGTTDVASSVISQNGPVDTRYMKVRLVFGGTSPSFNVAIKYIATVAGPSD